MEQLPTVVDNGIHKLVQMGALLNLRILAQIQILLQVCTASQMIPVHITKILLVQKSHST
jgi:hypothetical protein